MLLLLLFQSRPRAYKSEYYSPILVKYIQSQSEQVIPSDPYTFTVDE